MSNIFTITLIDSRNDEKIVSEDSCRCIGYYFDAEEANTAVKTNKGEMHECRYNYVVIEEVPMGTWKLTISESWFRWDSDSNKWIACKKPQKYRQYHNVSGFAMG